MRYRTCKRKFLEKNGFCGKRHSFPFLRSTILIIFRKTAIFVTFIKNYTIKFSKQFEKRKYRNFSKNFSFSPFSKS